MKGKLHPRPDTPKERQRLLRLMVGRPAQLHLPLSNKALLAMLDEGLIEVTHRWNELTGSGKRYQCVKLSITETGREALQ